MALVTIDSATREAVLNAAERISDLDKIDLSMLSFEQDIKDTCLSLLNMCDDSGYCWVFFYDGKPEAFYGVCETLPGIWSVFGFGTENFYKIKYTVTKFIKRRVIPIVVAKNARKAVALVRGDGNKWLQNLGAKIEVVLKGWGKDGSNYTMLTWDVKNYE